MSNFTKKLFVIILLLCCIQHISFAQVKEIYEGNMGEEIISLSLEFVEGDVSDKGIIKPGAVIIPTSWTTDKIMGSSKEAITWSGDTFKFQGLTFNMDTGDKFTAYFTFKRTLKTSSLQDYCADIEGTMEYTFNGEKKTFSFKASMVYCD